MVKIYPALAEGMWSSDPAVARFTVVECQRCGQPTPPAGSPDWVDWEPSQEGGWLCEFCLTDEVKDKADLALLLNYEPEMDGHWGVPPDE